MDSCGKIEDFRAANQLIGSNSGFIRLREDLFDVCVLCWWCSWGSELKDLDLWPIKFLAAITSKFRLDVHK